ncbi:MAG: hypothetical protein ACOYOU_01335 [Kiritimatiellia bacterium]
MPNSEQEDLQMRRDMEARAQERLKGKEFHDATVVSKEEVLKFQAMRDRKQEENNQRIQKEMLQPPTSFPFYADSAASGGHLPERAAPPASGSTDKVTQGGLLGISALTGAIVAWWIMSRWRRARSTRSG